MLHEVHLYRCPFCKTANYAVEYRGVKTKEEKGLEQIEEQRVKEAIIRMRQPGAFRDDKERTQNKIQNTIIAPGDLECWPAAGLQWKVRKLLSSQYSIRHPLHTGGNRDDEFDLDLEDIMVMEAIWLSIQFSLYVQKMITSKDLDLSLFSFCSNGL
ncbi:hypothetical protein NC652_028686 [Populus alba x Populus x berolinensis]|nr:hypothetical protein NC652_028686 [Populus alba x Populus x berolinensis]